MKGKYLNFGAFLSFFFVASFFIQANDFSKTPIPISPGRDEGAATVDRNCPTFSWSGVDWAVSYRVAVFEVGSSEDYKYRDIQAMATPRIIKDIHGQAFSWTPSTGEGLSSGANYIWYVAAVDSSGNEVWSAGKTFKVISVVTFASVEEQLKKKLKDSGVSSETIDQVFSGIKKEGKTGNQNQPIRGPLGTENANYTYYGVGAGGTCTSSRNSFFGVNAGNSTHEGIDNTYVGHEAGTSEYDGYCNTFVGARAGYSNNGGLNIVLYGSDNTFIGAYSGYLNTQGRDNTFIGYKAGENNVDGSFNTFQGVYSGKANTEGDYNTFYGHGAGYWNTTGSYNTFVGRTAGNNNSTGNSNVFLGNCAGYNETGSNKLYIDNSDTGTPLIWGDFFSNYLTINGNLGIGTTTPSSEIEISKTASSPMINIIRTDGAHFRLVAGQNNVQIGSVSAHGIKYLAGGSWKMQLNADGTLYMSDGGSYNGTWNDASSREFKENINVMDTSKAFHALENLEPVTFNYKTDKQELRAGFIAEDVPELVASKDRKNLSAMDIVAVLTKVVKEQQNQIKKQQKINKKLIKRIEELEKK